MSMITGRIGAERKFSKNPKAMHGAAYCDLRLIGSIGCLALLLAWAAELRAATNTVAADDSVAQTQF